MVARAWGLRGGVGRSWQKGTSFQLKDLNRVSGSTVNMMTIVDNTVFCNLILLID